jgi:hypothetical protein
MDKIIDFSGIPRFIDNTVKTYSSGMFARLGFAIAVHMDPEILVIDEILSVGDESFQRRCFDRISELQREGRTMIVVSHSLDVVKRLCDTCIWMDDGAVRARGPVKQVIEDYLADVSEHMGLVVHAATPGVHVVIETKPGPVRVREVQVAGPTELVHTGDPLEVSIRYDSEGPLRGALFQLNFVREDGIEVFWTTTGADSASRALPPSGEVVLAIPRLTLLEGRYRLGTSIIDQASKREHTLLATAFPLEVTSDESGYRGVSELGHRWVLPGEPATSDRTSVRSSAAE